MLAAEVVLFEMQLAIELAQDWVEDAANAKDGETGRQTGPGNGALARHAQPNRAPRINLQKSGHTKTQCCQPRTG